MTLAELLAAATPGPWTAWRDELYWKVDKAPEGPNVCNTGRTSWNDTEENARLIALAPDLARLALDMGEALEAVGRYLASYGDTSEAVPRIEALLVRLDGIANKDKTT